MTEKKRKRAERVDWDDWEDAFIVRHFCSGRKSRSEIAKALHRPYNQVKCHIQYLERTGKLDGISRDDTVWENEFESKREFVKKIVQKYGLQKGDEN